MLTGLINLILTLCIVTDCASECKGLTLVCVVWRDKRQAQREEGKIVISEIDAKWCQVGRRGATVTESVWNDEAQQFGLIFSSCAVLPLFSSRQCFHLMHKRQGWCCQRCVCTRMRNARRGWVKLPLCQLLQCYCIPWLDRCLLNSLTYELHIYKQPLEIIFVKLKKSINVETWKHLNVS